MNIDFSKLTFSADTWPLKRWALTVTAAEHRAVCEDRDENGKTEISDHRCSDAEWTGYIAAYSQWHCGCTFKEMFSAVSAGRMMSLRDTTHGDAMSAVSIIIDTLNPVTVLKRLREERGISQSERALYSGVPIRSIRAYEQGTVDLCRAQGDTLYSLAKVLGCSVDVLIRG